MHIPKQAKRVFKGVIFDVYHWPQKMFDGTIEIFEMIKRATAVQVIATQGDKIIICRQKRPTNKTYHINLFGGSANKGETPLQAAKRELLEESGLKSNDWKFLKAYNPSFKLDWPIYFYVARNCQKVDKQNLDNGELIKPFAVSFEKFVNMILNNDFFCADFALDLSLMVTNKKLNQFKQKLFKK